MKKLIDTAYESNINNNINNVNISNITNNSEVAKVYFSSDNTHCNIVVNVNDEVGIPSTLLTKPLDKMRLFGKFF